MIQSSYTPVKPKNYQADALTKPNKQYLDSENHRGFRQNRINYRGKALKQAQNRLMAQKAREIQKQINESAKPVENPIGMTAPVNPPKVGFIGRTLQSFGISRQGKGLIAYATLYVFFSYHSFNFHSHNSIFQTMELKQVPIRISPEAHAKATADAQAQGKTIAKHLSDIVDAMILTPPAPVPAETPAEQSAPIGFVQAEPEQPAPAPAPAEQPETKVVAEPAPYVFNGI